MTHSTVFLLALPFLSISHGFTPGGWRVSLNIGSEIGSPFTWATSGARLPITVPCDFDLDSKCVVPRSDDIRFTAQGGEVVKPVEGGTWNLNNNRDLSFTLTFPEKIVKNDVTIDAGTTLTMDGLMYTKNDLDYLNQQFYAARDEEWKAMEEIDEMDRRRDAPKKWNPTTNQWEKRYSHEPLSSQLSKRFQVFQKEQKRKDEDAKRPRPRDLSTDCGPFPGVEGDAYIAIGGKVNYQGVRGTWTAEPILSKELNVKLPSYVKYESRRELQTS